MTRSKSNEDISSVALKRDNSDRTLTSSAKIQGSLTTLGDACGVAILLGNHAKFGLAERCCYHFDLIETLTSLPAPHTISGRDRGDSLSSQDGRDSNYFAPARMKETTSNNTPNALEQSSEEPKLASFNPPKSCYCGVVSLLECIPSTASDSRITKRALRSKHREFNTRAQKAWGRAHGTPKRQSKSASHNSEGNDNFSVLRHCHQPRHLPLPLNPSTRVTFAYELTSIAIVVDASPSMTAATFLNENYDLADGCCVPLDRLGSMLKSYLKGMIQPIEVPPVSVAGQGIAFGRWTPNLAITVVASYPPSVRGDRGSAGILVRDFRVGDEKSALKLVEEVEKWALQNVEGMIADRLGGERSHFGNGLGGRSTQGKISAQNNLPVTSRISWTSIRSSMKDILAVGDAALATLPPEGRPVVVVVSDCLNVHCTGVFDYLSETSRSDVPISVINLSNATFTSDEYSANIYASLPIDVSEDSKSLRDACQQSGGIFLDGSLLDSYVNMNAGSSACMSTPFHGDVHFTSKKRSIRPNALQWYSLFCLSPLTPGYSSHSPTRSISAMGNSRGTKHQPHDSMSTFDGQSFEVSKPSVVSSNGEISFSTQAAALSERTFFVKYNINPVRVKSLLMSRILEGYRARKYGQNTQDPDKVSIHMTLKLSDCGVTLHYEVSFVSSPHHLPTVGSAHIKLELSGDDVEFISFAKDKFHGVQQGRSFSSISSKAADKICHFLKWLRKEDDLETYLCLPGWDQIDYFSKSHSFQRGLETLTTLQRHRHFRSEAIEVVTLQGSKQQNQSHALFGDLMDNDEGEDNLFDAILSWASSVIAERTTYVKILPVKHDDLTYYLVIRVLRCSVASRLFTITMDFHGELDAEERLNIMASFRERLNCYDNIVVLEKNISRFIAVRPKSREATWTPRLAEYFLHHRSWNIIQDPEVLPLITKRRNLVGNFMIIHSEEKRAVFAKFANDDTVVYQVLLRPEGIFVDIHMEPKRGLFNPYSAKDSTFRAIYEKVKAKDMECAKNLHARTNLLQALDCSSDYRTSQPGDIVRLINISSRSERSIRFFKGNSSANDMLFQMTSDFMISGLLKTQTAKLSIDGDGKVANYVGQWFLMRIDWYVLSAIHLSMDTMEADNGTFSRLIFFTAGISTLYPNDDSNTEDVAMDDNDDDIYGLDLILHDIEQSHGKNYALALYQSLRQPGFDTSDLSEDDVAFAMSFCTFKTVLEEIISVEDLSDQLGHDVETTTGVKLHVLLLTLLNQVPMSNGQLFYYVCEDGENDISNQDNEIGSSHLSRHSNDEESDTQFHNEDPPLFFRLTLDGNVATQQHIRSLKKSTTLELAVSTFDIKQNLSPMHLKVITMLKKALDSFIAEQQLQSFRFHGSIPSEEDLCTISKLLPQTKHLSSNVPLSFFAAKTKSLISASDPGNNEHDLEHGYSTLLTQLQNWCTLRASNSSFLALEDSEQTQLIPYWCFVQVIRSMGIVAVKVFHPLGNEAAQEVIERTRVRVIKTCHRTNQLLLLQDLYKTRTASCLVVAENEELPNCPPEATFACPIQHKETMALNSRSTPRQAIDSLISSTLLHNFLISNRRRMFTYKDEENNIFYIKLQENASAVELCVHGLAVPGPSITHQLISLLKRGMLMLPLNAISSVLMKNPYYALNEEDVEFVRTFNDQMSQLDSEYISSSAKSRRLYALPSHIRDPLLILLLFRRNITGSTFIHHLHESRDDNSSSLSDIIDEANGEMHICIPPKEFTFFFNSTPSQLDPNYQTVSTLTERGKQFSREAGSGIAIIELCLVDNDGTENVISVNGKREQISSGVSKKDIVLQRANEDAACFKLAVNITNTTVDIEVLHKWVELSLNQVLLTWHIETIIDHSKTAHYERSSKELQKVVPQLPVLEDMMKIAIQLPHPAVGVCRKESMIRAKSLAAITLQMNEMILSTLCQKSKTALPGVSTIRCSKTACIVTIKRDSRSKDFVVVSAAGKGLVDKTIDNTQYISVFGLGSFDQFSIITPAQLFFKEAFDVKPTQDTAFAQAMAMVKKKYPSLFSRHVAFVLRVSRSSRILLGYNMHPQIWSTVKQRFFEIDDAMSKQDEMHRISLQAKCGIVRGASSMPKLSPKPTTTPKPANIPAGEIKDDTPNAPVDDGSAMRGPKRRIPRPTAMLRPKLIGKSVEGSAMQAVKASRLRASSRPLPPQRSVSGSGKVIAPPRDKEKSKSKKTSSATKDTPSSQQHNILHHASQTKLFREISALTKVAHLSITNSKVNQSSIQFMVDNFMQSTKKDSEIQLPIFCVFANCYSNYMGTQSIEHLNCDNENSLLPFLDQLMKSFRSKGAVPLGRLLHSGSKIASPLFVAKELVSNSDRHDHQATIILQLSTTWGSNKKSHILCTAWLFHTTNHDENRKRLKAYVRQNTANRKGAIIDHLVEDFVTDLNLESEVLNYAGSRLAAAARGIQVPGNLPSTVSLLRSAMARYEESRSCRHDCAEYHIQRRFLSPSTFLPDLPQVSFQKQIMSSFLSANCKEYHLLYCGSSQDPCFVGSLNVVGLLVHFFITWHESVRSAFDIFVLTETKGQRLDLFVGKEGSPIAEKRSHVVLYSTMGLVQKILTRAALDQRRRHLWSFFGKNYQPSSSINDHEVVEMIETSQKIPLASIDQRVQSLFDISELQLPWRELLSQISKTPPFTHCISFSSDEATFYVIYVKSHDLYLSFKMQNEMFTETYLLFCNKTDASGDTENDWEVVSVGVVEQFTDDVTKWLFDSCCKFSVA